MVATPPLPDAVSARPEIAVAPAPVTPSIRPSDVQAAARARAGLRGRADHRQVLLHRGFDREETARAFLHPKLADLTPPDRMVDRSEAADRLARAVRAKERIVVFGDYDVDGTTSATILAEILTALGGDVARFCANRFQGGYGFSEPALERALRGGAKVIVTCDCGSADHARIDAARAKGVDVVVVDHHLVPDEPLPAYAFLNPHRPDCGFPFKGLCSAGLALSIGAAIRAELGARLDLRRWLDLVALGTIADVAPLSGDNRALTRAGLSLLASPNARPGVLALREVARIREGVAVGGVDVAFRLAPRLNAAGRLGDPELTLSLLGAATLPDARARAARLDQVNKERRSIERRITEEAVAQVLDVYGPRPNGGVVVAAEGWHRGVVGIVAARVAERFEAPALVVALEDGVGHGSGRTPDGFDLHAAIGRCEEHLLGFGGHAAAAGLSVEGGRVDALRAAFDDECRARRREVAPPPRRPIDVVIGGGFPLPTAAELALLEPVGEGNPEPALPRRGRRGRGRQHRRGGPPEAPAEGRPAPAERLRLGARRPARRRGGLRHRRRLASAGQLAGRRRSRAAHRLPRLKLATLARRAGRPEDRPPRLDRPRDERSRP